MIKSSATTRLVVTVIGTILLPLVIYSIYEITSIKEDEEVMERIYKDQLDAILFSANQYSDDAINGVLDKFESRLSTNLALIGQNNSFLQYSNILSAYLIRADSSYQSVLTIDSTVAAVDWKSIAEEFLDKNQLIIDQILRYKEAGYRKIEPQVTTSIHGKEVQVIFAILELSKGEKVILIGFIDVLGFAEDVLSPKLQQIAGEDLVISLSSANSNELIFCTDSLTNEISLSKPMWLFPNMFMGISSQNKSVKELVAERTRFNLLAAFILILLLIFGFSLVLRNLRREIHLAQTKSDFVSNVSHEIRTPLALISMFAETLMLDRVPNAEKRKEYEKIIFKETHRLTNIVNKILNFSQIEAGNRRYSFSKFDLNDLVYEITHDYEFHLERNGFTHEIKYLETTLPILADKEAIYEALVNLLDNAMKYSDDTRHININTGMNESGVFVEISDQGIGISPNEVKQIFDKFYRVTDGDVHTRKGAGLGLSLVHHIMDAHKGDIEVESTKDYGSTFRLVFKNIIDDQNTYS
ncbi:MAG: two-component system phosphate regulon sensor histidine kinase PhoR [Cyclobacteriaceae bacterium]